MTRPRLTVGEVIRSCLDEFLEKYKGARASKTSIAVSRPEPVRPGDPDYELVRRRRRQPTHAVPVREIKARLARQK